MDQAMLGELAVPKTSSGKLLSPVAAHGKNQHVPQLSREDELTRKTTDLCFSARPEVEQTIAEDALSRVGRAMSQYFPSREKLGFLGWGRSRVRRMVKVIQEDILGMKGKTPVEEESLVIDTPQFSTVHGVQTDSSKDMTTARGCHTRFSGFEERSVQTPSKTQGDKLMRLASCDSPRSVFGTGSQEQGFYSPKDTARRSRRLKRVLFPLETEEW